MTMLITELRAAAALRPDTDEARLMERAADELAQQEAHTVSLLRAIDIISHDVLDRCDKTLAAVTRTPPNIKELEDEITRLNFVLDAYVERER